MVKYYVHDASSVSSGGLHQRQWWTTTAAMAAAEKVGQAKGLPDNDKKVLFTQ